MFDDADRTVNHNRALSQREREREREETSNFEGVSGKVRFVTNN